MAAGSPMDMPDAPTEEHIPPIPPRLHHYISEERRHFLNIPSYLSSHLHDPATQVCMLLFLFCPCYSHVFC